MRAARFLASLSTARVSFTISARTRFNIGVHRSSFAVRRSVVLRRSRARFRKNRSPFPVHRSGLDSDFCILLKPFACYASGQKEKKSGKSCEDEAVCPEKQGDVTRKENGLKRLD